VEAQNLKGVMVFGGNNPVDFGIYITVHMRGFYWYGLLSL